MNCIGVIAEYNPFHIGHAHHLQQLRKAHPDALLIIAMSGSFVQRGEPAIINKFIRARWALLNGADAVLELPTIYATANAERFAAGAMRLLAATGVNAISFGSETTDLKALQHLAQLYETPTVQAHCHTLMKKGLFYGAALRQAIAQEAPELEFIVHQPNALLGIEYIHANQIYDLNLTLYPVKRNGQHHSQELSTPWPSGSALRNYLYTATTPTITPHIPLSKNLLTIQNTTKNKPCMQPKDYFLPTTYIPSSILSDYETILQQGNLVNPNRYSDYILYESRQRTAKELQQICDFKEGLENRWLTASQAASWGEACSILKSKRYSYARLQRMACYTVLSISQNLQDAAHQQSPTYARLLGFTEKARPWLQQKQFTIPVIQKWAPFIKKAQGLTATLAQLDVRATDIQQLCFQSPQTRKGGLDYTFTPWYIPHNKKINL